MAVAKYPGVGQGHGGGRPKGKSTKPARQVEEVRLRLSPHVAELLRAMAEDQGAPAWRVVELALLAGKGTMVITTTEPGTRVSNATIEGWNPIPPPAAPPAAGEGVVVTTTPSSPPPLPPEAQEIAQECAAFLEAQEDRAAALKVLRRAWMQALALTRLELRADP